MRDLVLELALLVGGEAEGLHLEVELLPVLFLLLLLMDHLRVALLDEILSCLHLLTRRLRHRHLLRHLELSI